MIAVGALLASALGSAPAWASEPDVQEIEPLASVCTGANRSCSWNYGGSSGWGGVKNEDRNCDGYSTYANYQRNSGGTQRLENTGGCNSTVETGSSSNLISRFRACAQVNFFPDWCSSWVSRS
jgi:hypothetical protein